MGQGMPVASTSTTVPHQVLVHKIVRDLVQRNQDPARVLDTPLWTWFAPVIFTVPADAWRAAVAQTGNVPLETVVAQAATHTQPTFGRSQLAGRIVAEIGATVHAILAHPDWSVAQRAKLLVLLERVVTSLLNRATGGGQTASRIRLPAACSAHGWFTPRDIALQVADLALRSDVWPTTALLPTWSHAHAHQVLAGWKQISSHEQLTQSIERAIRQTARVVPGATLLATMCAEVTGMKRRAAAQ